MVYRIYVEKREGLTVEADALKSDIVSFLGIKSLTGVRVQNRYDVENIEPELFEYPEMIRRIKEIYKYEYVARLTFVSLAIFIVRSPSVIPSAVGDEESL